MRITLVGNPNIQQVLRTEGEIGNRQLKVNLMIPSGPNSFLLRTSQLPFTKREWVVFHSPFTKNELSMPIIEVAHARGIPLSRVNDLVLETFMRSHNLTDIQSLKYPF